MSVTKVKYPDAPNNITSAPPEIGSPVINAVTVPLTNPTPVIQAVTTSDMATPSSNTASTVYW